MSMLFLLWQWMQKNKWELWDSFKVLIPKEINMTSIHQNVLRTSYHHFLEMSVLSQSNLNFLKLVLVVKTGTG